MAIAFSNHHTLIQERRKNKGQIGSGDQLRRLNLQLELSKFKREFLTNFPPEKAAIMQGATQALAKEFQNRRALRIDDEAPDFLLKNTDGQQISLVDYNTTWD